MPISFTVSYGEEQFELTFEHSLFAMSKWEAKHKKLFLSRMSPPSAMEMLEYYQDMLLSTDVDPNIVFAMEPGQLEELSNYINDPQTASTVPKTSGGSGEAMTTELIYYWMVAMKIPWEAQYWPFNRLLMLIQITNYKQQPDKDRNKQDTMQRWHDANERQKKMFNTKG